MNATSLFRCVFAVGLIFSAGSAPAATIALWTFETNPPASAGPIAPDQGAGIGTSVHATPGTFTNPSGNGSAESWNSNSWAVGDYYQFQVSTLGMHDIVFSWDQTRSSAGPVAANTTDPNFRLQYSTDGTNFSNVFDYVVPITSTSTAVWTSQLANFSTVTALDNQATVYFRTTAILASQNSGGQSRVDNVLVTGNLIPEPSCLVLTLLVIGCGMAQRMGRRIDHR